MPTYETVLEHARQLSYEDREKLVRELIPNLQPPGEQPPGENVSEDAWKAAWAAEIERRLGAYERGEVEAIPWRESVQQLRDALAAGPEAKE